MNSTNLTMEERAQIQFYTHMALEPMDDQSAVWNSIPEAEGYNCPYSKCVAALQQGADEDTWGRIGGGLQHYFLLQLHHLDNQKAHSVAKACRICLW